MSDFSKEDVDLLLFVAQANERDNIALFHEREGDSDGAKTIAALRGLASRIEALLPKESP